MITGKLRHKVEVLRATETRGTAGSAVPTWARLSYRWCEIQPLTGREYFYAQQVSSDITHKVTMRYYEGLTPNDRLKYGTRVFEIDSVKHVYETGKETVLMCKEVI